MTNTLKIVYRLRAEDGDSAEFVIGLDDQTLALQVVPRPDPPAWVQLAHHQCRDCPLDAQQVALCPMAAALADLLDFARGLVSHSTVAVTVSTPEREISAVTTAQRALSSLMGLIMATCACPEVAWLRPMARFHLPLASSEETIYRAASMYLLAQYFRQRNGAAPDFALEGLRDHYQRIHVINVAMSERLRGAVERDASINAVILLDLFAKAMPDSVSESLAELEYLFRPYLETGGEGGR
ncbi:DUF6901 family protein [Denitratisoma oestradiolicum]|uniref:Uncharacterized protein n=1 Tax=Denitratisoma oestradiolicum TaxID=311182 RepID=A0A6S6YLD8_9PROT|nr:hypothetical protein [Denitratisoma oestradiolicum]CAB1368544.1 conserved protein of unknown function [Denitratisoma oestradiolicum]